MTTQSKTYNLIIHMLFFIMGCMLLIVFLGACYIGMQGAGTTSIIISSFSLLVFSVLTSFIILSFKNIEKIGLKKQKHITMVLFIIYFVVLSLMIINIQPRPQTDGLHNIETGWYLINNVISDDYSHIKYIKAYGNNYLLIIITKWLIKMAMQFDLDVVLFLTICNALLMTTGLIIAFCLIKRFYGQKNANKLLLLVVLNPLYYMLSLWNYSASVSIPIMMSILSLLFTILGESKIKDSVCSVLVGGLAVIGYYIRPISVFPMIAFCVVITLKLINDWILTRQRPKREEVLHFAVCLTSIFLGVLLTAAIVNTSIDRYFQDVKQSNLPISYWLNIGSQGDGTLTGEGFQESIYDNSFQLEELDNNSTNYLQKTIDNYKELGFGGTTQLFTSKTITTFSNGYPILISRIFTGRFSRWIYKLVFNPLFKVYALSYRMMIAFGMVSFCAFGLMAKINTDKHSLFKLTLLITLLGAIVFYFFWEAKDDYSLPFMLIMTMLSLKGFNAFEKKASKLVGKKSTILSTMIIAASFILLVSTSWGVPVNGTNTTIIINGTTNGITNWDENLYFTDEITQTFVTDHNFNKITIDIVPPDDPKEISKYMFTLRNGSENIVSKTEVSLSSDESKSIKEKTIVLDVEKCQPGRYTLEIEKEEKQKESIIFYSGDNYYLDSYRGTLTVGNKDYVDDLSMTIKLETSLKGRGLNKATICWMLFYGMLFIATIIGILNYENYSKYA